MSTVTAVVIVSICCGFALGGVPDVSEPPAHPRLWMGGVRTGRAYVDPEAVKEKAKKRPELISQLSAAPEMRERALAAFATGDAEAARKVIDELKSVPSRGGHALADIALAFDWVAPFMDDAERIEIARHLGDIAEGRKQDFDGAFNTFHNYALQREMGIGLTALAIAGDDPRAGELLSTACSLFDEFIRLTGDHADSDDMDGRAAFGGGWPESYDYDRHGSYYAMKFFLGLRSATGTDVFRESPFWRAKMLYHIFFVLPNGYNILPLDDNDWPFLLGYDREIMLVLAREYDDPHARYYLNRVHMPEKNATPVFDLLFDEPERPEKDFTDLPKGCYFPGVGLVIARSGWGENDTYTAFRASDWFTYHQNNAQNVFFIYRNAPLAVKDGVYDGWDQPRFVNYTHFVNYTIRTISYNGVTVLDPAEKYGGHRRVAEPANDGGQMVHQWSSPRMMNLDDWREQARREEPPMRDIVDWKGFETTDTYTYAAAEAGRAYYPGKVPFFSRQLVFIYPNWVVVFDRVTAGDKSFAKKFHLHAPEEMEVSGRVAKITTRQTNHTTIPGRLFVRSLLPHGGNVERIDGLCFYAGTSWTGPEAYNDQVLCPHRLEITAPEEETSYFLTAMYACDADVEDAPAAEIIEETDDSVTVRLDGGEHTVKFNKTGEVAWEMVK